MGRRKGDDIADRLLNLGAAVVKLLPELGKRPGGKAVVKQLEPEWTKASSASFAGRSPRRSTEPKAKCTGVAGG